MARLGEEEARKRLVLFIDRNKPDKPVAGFGIELGPGLPERTRLIFYRFGAEFDKDDKDVILLLADDNPLVFIQRISFDGFISYFLHLSRLANDRYLVNRSDDTERYSIEELLVEECRLQHFSIYEMLNLVNSEIFRRVNEFERFIEECFLPLL